MTNWLTTSGKCSVAENLFEPPFYAQATILSLTVFYLWRTVMKNPNLHTSEAADGDRQDDISALRDAFSLHAFRYVDIAREERLKEILSRWTLLAETVPSQPEQPH